MIEESAQTFSTASWKNPEINMRLSDLYENFCQGDTGINIP